MTSINAIRFNRHQGAIICDETISCGDGQAVRASDKVQDCIPREVREAYGVVGAIATTGSCSVGQTFKNEFHDWIRDSYRTAVEAAGQRPASFLDLDALAAGLFDLVVRTKHRWMSQWLRGQYGFTVREFLGGSYERNGVTFEIKDADLQRRVTDWMAWKNQAVEVEGIFLNAGLFAGYDDACGFQIYHFDLREGYWHRVQTCYFCEGSGRWSADPAMYPFVERLRIDERRGDVDPILGLVALLAAVNAASEHETGVGGYPSVVLFDGRRPVPDRQRELADDRVWLASRAVKAHTTGFLDRESCHRVVEGVFYGDLDVDAGMELLWSRSRERAQLSRLLRGYKVEPLVP